MNTLKKKILALAKKFSWFGIVGVTAGMIYTFAMFFLNEKIRMSPYIANVLSLVCSSTISYLGHRYLTFKAVGWHRDYVLKFFCQVMFAYVFSLSCVFIATKYHLSYLFTVAMVWLCLPMINFLIMQFWIFTSSLFYE